jgi:nicotinate-nucleotide adenylyltransferase
LTRIGLFGGTFDPPHNAHLALARHARDELALDELRWIPAGDPWQKRDRAVTPAAHRAAMVALAIAGEPRCLLDTREIARQGPSYSVVTAQELQAEHPGAALFLVIGADQLAGLHSWHRVDELMALVTLAVAGRPGSAGAPDARIAAATRRAVALPPMDVSSTGIRARVAARLPIVSLVPPAVAGYIARHHLYEGPDPGH